ncbi:MAG: phospholipase D-like domain-containing protein [bacterium]|nr:phospholipase D-like domain-containing protein [bacterium]
MRVVKDYEGSAVIIAELDKTQNECVLVSPYVKLWDRLHLALERAIERGVRIEAFIRYPESDLDVNKVKGTVTDFTKLGVKTYLVKNLHAKIYSFDQSVIVSSMNLYDFSQQNSIELSVLFDESDTITEIKNYINDHIKRVAIPYHESSSNNIEKLVEKEGFCIRCRARIKDDPVHPLCSNCYTIWAKYGNPNYLENYCLSCGKEIKTNIAKPYCYECYSKNISKNKKEDNHVQTKPNPILIILIFAVLLFIFIQCITCQQ